MTVDEHHLAFPKLMGAPAYARPPSAAEPAERPFDPDALPILAEQTPEERALLDALGSAGSQAPIAVLPWPAAVTEQSPAPRGAAAAPGGPASRPVAPTMSGEQRSTPGPVRPETATPSPRAIAAHPFSLRELTDRLRRPR